MTTVRYNPNPSGFLTQILSMKNPHRIKDAVRSASSVEDLVEVATKRYTKARRILTYIQKMIALPDAIHVLDFPQGSASEIVTRIQ